MKFDLGWRLGLSWLALAPFAGAASAAALDFNREVRPILARHCFKCHGPDDKARKAKLRLDVREQALQTRALGKTPIVPCKPGQSELVARIFNADPEEVMPPRSAKLALSGEQKQILKRWIAEGAVYTPHWAFQKPRQAPLPPVKNAEWPRNPIDHFVLARLEAEGLRPSPPASPCTLVRRIYLDLIGLPPTPEEAEAFLADPSPAAYETLVDRLLASPQYGERWARKWLDLARYADTNGYEKDRPRSIWPWRDWVIKALDTDEPFDRFTVEQIAGDLLPNATPEQIIATGFHRNTMLNEEGGIDPLEFRFHAMTDRMATTGKTWLGLTIQCAQCHTHKFEPISHREYYQLMAFLNNADEPDYEVRPPDYDRRRAEIEDQIARIQADLTNRFELPEIQWTIPQRQRLTTASGQQPPRQRDGSWLIREHSPPLDTYALTLEAPAGRIDCVRLEALPDDQLPRRGPGRFESGNFVLTEFVLSAPPPNHPDESRPVKLRQATADYSQSGFDVAGAIDGDPQTGWAIAGSGKQGERSHTAVFHLAEPLRVPEGQRVEIRLEQNYGHGHTLGHFRLSLGTKILDDRPLAVRRHEAIEQAFAAWSAKESSNAVCWTVLRPLEAKANLPFLSVQADDSVLATGDQSKSDTYHLKFRTDLRRLTALRLEALPDDRFPKHGPGRAYYEGPPGDFNLSDFRLLVGGQRRAIARASHSFAADGFPASNAIDDNQQTGWAINGGQGRRHCAVFNLAEPLAQAGEFDLELHFERHFCADLGRFRVAVTADPRPVIARDLPTEVEAALLAPVARRTPAQRECLFRHFLAVVAPELAASRAEIERLRQQLEAFPTTLVLRERPPENPRPTYIHNRGEFLQPTERVEPEVLSVLNPLPKGVPRNRLGFAQWLVSPDNPLTARVTVNRQWAAFFGRGIVRTVDDFGYQGDPPTHPELLDWLAVEFLRQGWSLKKLDKLIVLSATYQQASRLTPELLARDPSNALLARGPRLRLDAEMIRDSLLRAAGLLVTNVGGPSVFPPQPASVTTEDAYAPLNWKVSEGSDRYRRGLYTFSKRAAPYAMFNTFDAPSGETCIAQREVSNSPLQALTMLNDTVVIEAAQALGRTFASRPGPLEARVEQLFQCCLTRRPEGQERAMLVRFLREQEHRFQAHELDSAKLAGKGDGDPNERAAWTALARTLLNLDEMITKS